MMVLNAPVDGAYWCRAAPVSASALQKHWLLRPGALTDGLRSVGRLHLRVLREARVSASADEAVALGERVGAPLWVREVLMTIDGTAVVAARSLARLAATHGVWQGMRRLRTRPLADMLYHDRRIIRSRFAVARLQRPLAFYATLRRIKPDCDSSGRLLARRSVFWRDGQPLLVAECFLPDFWRLLDQSLACSSILTAKLALCLHRIQSRVGWLPGRARTGGQFAQLGQGSEALIA